jgi:hypothetical protein
VGPPPEFLPVFRRPPRHRSRLWVHRRTLNPLGRPGFCPGPTQSSRPRELPPVGMQSLRSPYDRSHNTQHSPDLHPGRGKRPLLAVEDSENVTSPEGTSDSHAEASSIPGTFPRRKCCRTRGSQSSQKDPLASARRLGSSGVELTPGQSKYERRRSVRRGQNKLAPCSKPSVEPVHGSYCSRQDDMPFPAVRNTCRLDCSSQELAMPQRRMSMGCP